MAFLKRLFRAALNLTLGVGLGLLGLEVVLRASPGLLLRGMALPAPVDPPVTVQEYEVHYSDADLFFWHSQLIRPIPPERDFLEARVRFETDEFGFPNPAPLPEKVDVVVLGRSFSLGSQAAHPWPRLLAAQTGLEVMNLSQGASGVQLKQHYLKTFGWVRRPQWVVVEMLPSLDIVWYAQVPPFLATSLPTPIIQGLARRAPADVWAREAPDPIYPLRVDIPGRTVELTFFSYYLAALTADRSMLTSSNQWEAYRQGLLELVKDARAHSACVVLLYAPTKSAVYFPLATHPEQLAPTLTMGWSPLRLNADSDLISEPGASIEIPQMQANAAAARDTLAAFAAEQHLPFVDPTQEMTRAALRGDGPFMVYDTHWNAVGHQIVARLVADTLQNVPCP